MGSIMTIVSIDGLFVPFLEGGLARKRLQEIEGELRHAHRELMSRRGKDIDFYDVPLATTVIKTVTTEVTRLRSLADDLLVLGIGGSSLGGQAIHSALCGTADRSFRVHFVDNIDPDTLSSLLERLDPAKTATAVISKSGTTVETLALLLIVRRWFRVSLGKGEMRSRMTAVTGTEDSLLRELCQAEGIRVFEIPTHVAGRYSALTAVGLLPAAFVGIDIGALLEGAASMVKKVTADDVLDNPACILAAGGWLASHDLGRTSLVMMPYCDALRTTTAWFVQLWGESLGKRRNRLGEEVRTGQTPIPAVGATDQHTQLQLFLEGPRDKAVMLVEVAKHRSLLPIPDELEEREEATFLHGRDLSEILDAERRATRAALLEGGVPVIDVVLPVLDPARMGALLVLFQAACATTGIMLGVNPFDQPGVEESRRMALGLLGRPGYESEAKRVLLRESPRRGPEGID